MSTFDTTEFQLLLLVQTKSDIINLIMCVGAAPLLLGAGVLCEREVAQLGQLLQVAQLVEATDVVLAHVQLTELAAVLEICQARDVVHTANSKVAHQTFCLISTANSMRNK